MITGYRTYITIVINAIYNAALAGNIELGDISPETIDSAITVILGVVALIYNYLGRKKLSP